MNVDDECYTFVVEWYDSVADLNRKYNLRYWPKDSSLSMYDLAKNRLFLKRVINKDVKFPKDFYINKNIVVYSRQLKIISYGDKFTSSKFECISNSYNILFVGFNSFIKYLNKVDFKSFNLKNIKSVEGNHQINEYLNIQNKNNDILLMCDFIGNTDIIKIFNECLNSSNNNNNFNGVICNGQENKALIDYISLLPSSAKLTNNNENENNNFSSSLCLIKPHSISQTALIISDIINEGFNITAITTKKLNLLQAKNFYEVYKNVVKEYNYMIEQILSGAVIVLQIGFFNNDSNKNQFNQFREFVGPKDPEIAKYIRPNTLRAKYGTDIVKNAVHCTDLQEDGYLESKFFFEILPEE